jgi:hypothetical protein
MPGICASSGTEVHGILQNKVVWAGTGNFKRRWQVIKKPCVFNLSNAASHTCTLKPQLQHCEKLETVRNLKLTNERELVISSASRMLYLYQVFLWLYDLLNSAIT